MCMYVCSHACLTCSNATLKLAKLGGSKAAKRENTGACLTGLYAPLPGSASSADDSGALTESSMFFPFFFYLYAWQFNSVIIKWALSFGRGGGGGGLGRSLPPISRSIAVQINLSTGLSLLLLLLRACAITGLASLSIRLC